jgi:uncharacterized protein (DUF427 family)
MRDLFQAARADLRYEPIEKRVRASAGADTLVDTTRAVLLWEPRRICPIYAVPADEIRAELEPAEASHEEVPGVLHPGIPFSVHTAAGEPVTVSGHAGFRLADPELAGYVALDFEAFDWLEEDDPVRGHPRDPYHRVDVHQTSRRVRIEFDGTLVADSSRARLVFETQLPTRFYLPREDIRVPLRPSALRTYCPYKGEASYFSFDGGEDLLWSYEQPLPDATQLTELLGFWDERFDIELDGRRRAEPRSELSQLMLDEFGVR